MPYFDIHFNFPSLNLTVQSPILQINKMEPRMRNGSQLLQMLWYFTAQRIVETAINFHKLDEERADALRQIYLRPGDYTIRVKNLHE